LIIFGGGPVGAELGQAFARLGTRVTFLIRGDKFLPREDRDAANFL
jgi:pyruvate/2-oxoglutarate dehydrogenase complex dihydrolipoamide dehydrogenase (E3) component